MMKILENFLIEAQIMPLRLNAGIESLQIFKKTDLMFLQYSNGAANEQIFKPISMVEPGFILILPFISNLVKIDYQTLANIFFYFFLFLSIGSIFYFISQSVNKFYYKIFSYFFVILINFYMYNRLFGLVVEWILYFYSAQLILPLSLLIIQKKIKNNIFTIGTIFFIAILIDQFRSYASLGSVLFLTLILAINERKFFKKIIILSIFAFYIAFPQLLNNYIENKQKENYYKLFSSYYHSEVKVNASIWYNVYRGLGFINGGDVKGYNDEVIHQFLDEKKNNKNFEPSDENNKLLKNEIIRIIKSDPGFVLRLYSAKLGVIFVYFIIFANIGIFLFFTKKINLYIKMSFGIAFIFYSIPPMLAIPGLAYLGGVIGLGVFLFCYLLSFKK